jgi:hypothetical protein
MQVLCVASQEAEAAISCPICGQQYEVFYARNVPSECEAALSDVKNALVSQHATAHRSGAHPEAFNVPHWSGQPFASGAALLGGARPPRRPVAAETVSLHLLSRDAV